MYLEDAKDKYNLNNLNNNKNNKIKPNIAKITQQLLINISKI